MTQWLEGGAVGLALGLVFALLGAGGGGLSVPTLLYLLHARLDVATGTALAIVCGAATAGGIRHYRAGRVVLKVAVPVGLASILGAVAGSVLQPLVGERIRLLLFIAALVASGVSMLVPRRAVEGVSEPMALPWLLLLGVTLGCFTGFLGVGGGFILVPALTTVGRLPLKPAIGTSLAVIGVSTLSGAVTHALQGHLSLELLLPVGTGAIIGAMLGARLSGKAPEQVLRVGFAVLVFAVAAVMLVRG